MKTLAILACLCYIFDFFSLKSLVSVIFGIKHKIFTKNIKSSVKIKYHWKLFPFIIFAVHNFITSQNIWSAEILELWLVLFIPTNATLKSVVTTCHVSSFEMLEGISSKISHLRLKYFQLLLYGNSHLRHALVPGIPIL